MLSIIAILAPNNAIGFQQQLLWKISEDLLHFKQLTTGHPIIMGRKTFESIGKPLPNRTNIVLSKTLQESPAHGVIVAASLPQAITWAEQAAPAHEIFVIGGAELYQQALLLSNKLYITHVKAPIPQADAFFPRVDWRQWREISRVDHPHGASFPHPFSFVVYERTLLQHNYNIDPFNIYS